MASNDGINNKDLERMCKEAISLLLGIFADIRMEKLRRSKKGVRLNSQSSVRDLKP